MIAIVDYGAGNIRSVERAVHAAASLAGLSPDIRLVREPDQLRRAERVLFPGQGAMPDCMASLRSSGLEAALREVMRELPFFGICVGEQMLFDHSEEGDTPGLGILPGEVVRITADRGAVSPEGEPLKVPHMGWNAVHFNRPHPVLDGLDQLPLPQAAQSQAAQIQAARTESDAGGHWFYFVHSFVAQPARASDLLGIADYGMKLPVAFARDNLVATQFHPEKSAEAGLRLLQNFLTWQPS